MLAARVRDGLETVYLPYAGLPPLELGAWVLQLLGSPPAKDPARALRAFSSHLLEQKSGLLIMIDDAGALPDDTARWLGDLVSSSDGALRLLIAASDDATGSRTIAAIGASFNIVSLTQPMSESETAQYIKRRLMRAQIPDSIQQRFDAPMIRQLHRTAAGIPSNLHSAAAAVLRSMPTTTPPAVVEPDPILDALIQAQMVSPKVASEGIPTSEDLGTRADWTTLAPPPLRRIEPPPPRHRVLLGALLIAGISVAIPLIRSLLPVPSQPRTLAAEVPTVVETVELGSVAENQATPPERARPAAPVDTKLLGPFRVQVNATPWATVRVDGIDFGETPIANIPLLAGPHTFRVQMSDGRVIERVVEIDAEKRFVSFE
jgi:hypothetical protein